MTEMLTIAGQQLAYSQAGDPQNPAVLLVHGWLSHRGVWRQTIPALQNAYHCVAFDLLGFGESDKPAGGDYSLEAQGRRLLQAADQLGLERFALLGHSMGGQIALWMAARLAPERVTRLVDVGGVVSGRLSSTVERKNWPTIRLARRWPGILSCLSQMARVPALAQRLFDVWFYDPRAVPFATWEVDRALAFRRQQAISGYLAGLALHKLDLTADLSRIRVPTLVIFGKQDGTVPLSEGRLAAEHIPNAQIVWIEACGHFPMYEQTQKYLAALLPFMGL